MVRIIISFQNPVRYLTIHSVGPGGKHIGNAYTFASLIPSAFYLMGGNSASPQKFSGNVRILLLLYFKLMMVSVKASCLPVPVFTALSVSVTI